jgi:hypothetical protein
MKRIEHATRNSGVSTMSQRDRLARQIGMMKWLINRRLDAFQKTYGYDVTYMRELLAADTRALLRWARVSGISQYRRDVPKDVYYAAKLTSIIAEDCGPCSQLVVGMALRDGIDARLIANVIESNDALLSEPVRLGVQYARAVLAREPAADELREAIAKRWGQRAVVSLAFAITASRLYPTLKYALGHGHACRRLDVAGETIVPRRAKQASVLRGIA